MTDINSLEDRIKKLEKRVDILERKSVKQLKKPEGEFKGLTGAISDLIEGSFFNQPKRLSEIQKQLEANGFFYPKTSYPDALLRLIRKKKMRRLEMDGKWKYVK